MPLKENIPAPDFTLKDETGKKCISCLIIAERMCYCIFIPRMILLDALQRLAISEMITAAMRRQA